MKPAIFVLDRFSAQEPFTIRLVIPGIDGGHAVTLETTFNRGTRYEVERIVEQIVKELPKTVHLDSEELV